MKRKLICLLMIACIGTLSWVSAQTPKPELFDAKKTRQEIEVMKGILATTISFFARDLRGKEPADAGLLGKWYGGRLDQVSAYYLYGQGVTFIVPVSSLDSVLGGAKFAYAGDLDEMNAVLADSKRAMDDARLVLGRLGAEEEAEAALEAAVAAQEAAGPPTPRVAPAPAAAPRAAQAPAPPAPPVSATTPAPMRRSQEEMKKRVTEAQEKVRQRREQSEQRRQRLLKAVDELKVYLIEALANHGDSLTQLKPGEYINIVITTDNGHWGLFGGTTEDPERQVISVQKSWVTDYKAGRITLDGFKQKALQYRT